eukprot:gene7937-7349_t
MASSPTAQSDLEDQQFLFFAALETDGMLAPPLPVQKELPFRVLANGFARSTALTATPLADNLPPRYINAGQSFPFGIQFLQSGQASGSGIAGTSLTLITLDGPAGHLRALSQSVVAPDGSAVFSDVVLDFT